MRTIKLSIFGLQMCTLAVLLSGVAPVCADDAKSKYPAMAPIDQYRSASTADEIALARSAAPKSISGDAEVLTLGERDYETAAKGKNGFVCLVERAWAADFDEAEFWNPKLRSPMCYNAVAARTVLPGYLERTRWVLAGVSVKDMISRTKAAVAASTYVLPGVGALTYMMSKQGNLNDAAGHWHPHLMFYLAHTDGVAWGADVEGSPVYASPSQLEPVTTFFVPVPKWSDGSPADMKMN